MQPVTLKLSQLGPTVTALVRPRGANAPELSLLALLDTGADRVFAQQGLLASKGFTPAPGSLQISSLVGTSGNLPGFFVEIAVCLSPGQQLDWWPFDIGEANVAVLGVNLVLGREFLDRCDFRYDGRGGEFTLSW